MHGQQNIKETHRGFALKFEAKVFFETSADL